MPFMKCDICNKECIMEFYKIFLKLKTHINILEKPNMIWKYCDNCSGNSNNSRRNRHKKKHKAIVSN